MKITKKLKKQFGYVTFIVIEFIGSAIASAIFTLISQASYIANFKIIAFVSLLASLLLITYACAVLKFNFEVFKSNHKVK